MDMLKDVGKGYYCDYVDLLPKNFKGCPASKRTTCVGCKAHKRKRRKEEFPLTVWAARK